MRILVTGASGQVGSAFVTANRKHEIIAADRTTMDLAQAEKIPRVLEALEPELIVNAAAYTAVDRAESEPELAKSVNADAPGVIAQWAAARGVSLIHLSTDYVFDGGGDAPWDETDAAVPLSVYGRTKLQGEIAVRAAGGNCLIVRTSWVYAATGKNFLRTIVRLAREHRQIRIVADQIGAPTSAALVANSLTDMIAGDVEDFRRRCAQAEGIVHLAASGKTSWHGFACAIVEGLRMRDVALEVEEIVPIASTDYPTPARRPRNSRLDLKRLHEVFEMSPVHWKRALEPELDVLAVEMR